MGHLFRCILSGGWDEQLVRAKSPVRAAMIYRSVLRERGAKMLEVRPVCEVYLLTEPEGNEGLIYEALQDPQRFDLASSQIQKA